MAESNYEVNLKYRKNDGDWSFGHGEQDFVHGAEAMQLAIRTRLKVYGEEWWEGDPTSLPYFDEIIGTATIERNKDIIDLYIIERITDTIGVLNVRDVESSFEGRKYSFKCKVDTVYGETTAETEVSL